MILDKRRERKFIRHIGTLDEYTVVPFLFRFLVGFSFHEYLFLLVMLIFLHSFCLYPGSIYLIQKFNSIILGWYCFNGLHSTYYSYGGTFPLLSVILSLPSFSKIN